MTNQEAIEQLKFDMSMIFFNPYTGEEFTLEQVRLQNEDNYKTYLADQLAIAALEKQEPKESPHETPVMVKAFDGEGKALTYECASCPSCKKWLSIFGTGKSYCPYCGQAVKSRKYNEQE